MSNVMNRASEDHQTTRRRALRPIADKPFTLDQELEPFARWAGRSLWVPPRDRSTAFARTMLASSFWPRSSFTARGRDRGWSAVLDQHRSEFAHVRGIDLFKASIRLPKGRLLVTVTDQEHFDSITDKVPACVRTRLDEFLDGPGKRAGVKVSYLKPLCIEVGDRLIFTTRDNVEAAMRRVQDDVFAEYRRLFAGDLARRAVDGIASTALAIPRAMVDFYIDRQKKALEVQRNRLEFQRRKYALEAALNHRQTFNSRCSCDEMLQLMSPVQEIDVVKHYALEHDLSSAEFEHLVQVAAGTLPWFVAFSLATAFVMSLTATVTAQTVTTASTVAVCDPVFVAELPESPGVLLKIGHFDEIAGVTHVEI
jgi:hypothetical protein